MRMKCKGFFTLLIGLVAFVLVSPTRAARPPVEMQKVQIVAEEMCCQGCARKVSGQLFTARGVKDVGVDMKTRTVTISLPKPSPAMLGQLWHAVEQGDGGPTKLVTAEATYSLVRPKDPADTPQSAPANQPVSIVVDNLHCEGCAKKIAAQLYTIKGVTKVSVDMQRDTLLVKARSGTKLSPWQMAHAVTQAKERPVAVHGPHGTLAIKWSAKRATKIHEHAQQTTKGGIQR